MYQTPTSKRGDAVVRPNALKASNYRHLPLAETLIYACRINMIDTGGTMHIIGMDWHLPSKP